MLASAGLSLKVSLSILKLRTNPDQFGGLVDSGSVTVWAPNGGSEMDHGLIQPTKHLGGSVVDWWIGVDWGIWWRPGDPCIILMSLLMVKYTNFHS